MSFKGKSIGRNGTSHGKITAFLVALAMVVAGAAFGVTSPLVANAAAEVATWDALESAIGNGETDITVTEDLYADSTIAISGNVSIKGKDGGVTIYQKKRDSGTYETMFSVGNGGDLTLGDNLALSGKTGCAGGGGGGGGSQTAFLHSEYGYLANTFVEKVSTSETIGDLHKTIELEIKTIQNSQGQDIQRAFVKIKGKYITCNSSDLTLTDTFDENKVTFLTNSAFADVTSITNGQTYYLYTHCNDPNYDGFVYYNDALPGIVSGGNNSSALEWTASNVATGSSGGQTCDGADCPEDDTYTESTFPGGSVSAPKGFFVQVEGGGTATLAGAILENFNTSRDKGTTPKSVAPVAVKGAGSTFNVTSGEIRNNIVGYIVEDSKAYESADTIKAYVKGAAPNAQRKPRSLRRNRKADIDGDDPGSGITATAGAILYGDGTKGTISGGFIKFNRGDTGGIMATGTDTLVTLEGSTNINNNVGVQFGGGVTTEDDAAIVMSSGTINNNVAWFGGGGVYATENGVEWLRGDITDKDARKDGNFRMDGGYIEDNTAFTRGGGFFVDSDGVTLINGVIRGNMSRMLGGGMYVMGDHPDFTYSVYINKGYVHENKAVSSGSKERSYVATDTDNQILSRKLVAPPDSCDTNITNLFDGQMTKNSDDMNDGYPKEGSDGTGGGIWLCAYGNTVLNVSKDDDGKDTFIIDKNSATGSIMPNCQSSKENQVYESTSSDTHKSGGNDIHKETKGPGNIVIYPLETTNPVNWYDEVTGELYTDPAKAVNASITDYSLKNLTNVGTQTPDGYARDSYNGVDVYENLSRRGGGLAADGTFLFGNTRSLGEAYSELAVTKTWAGGVEPEDVTIRINLEYTEDGQDKTIEVIELPLSEIDFTEQASELDTVFTEGQTTDTAGRTVYLGHIVLPITVEDENGKKIQLFDLVSEVEKEILGGDVIPAGHTFPLNTADGLYELGRYIKADGTVMLSNAERKLTFVELFKDPNTGELVPTEGYEITPTAMKLSTNPAPNIEEHDVIQIGTDGKPTVVGTIITSDVRFEADLVNDKPAEIEKYINKAVHQNIALDQKFEYDIMAYVKHGTDKLEITDKLVEELAFVSDVSGVKVEVLDGNNHKPLNDISGTAIDGNDSATVAKTGTPVTMEGDYKKVEIDEGSKTLTVTIANKLEEVKDANDIVIGYKNADDEQNLTDLWGKWVRVTYKAQIDPEIQERIKNGEMTVKDLHSDYVTVKADDKYKPEDSIYGKDDEGEEIYRPTPNKGNAPVESDEDHTGLENTASYSLEVKNEPSFKDESNTVTVKPELPEIEKYVNQAVHDFIDIEETFTYDIIAYITKDADEVTITDKLDAQLTFVSSPEDIAVVDLGEDVNHKVTNDINAKQVNDDASVAEAGEDIDEKTVTIEDDLLTVKLDDEGTVKALRGHWVKVTFDAKIKDGLTSKDLKYTKIDAKATENRDGPNVGNDPVLSNESHDGVPNKASYTIGVKNEGEIEEKYKDDSNTVTVKPEEYEVQFSKKLLDGGVIPGVKLTVLDSKGNEVESWTTGEEPHKLMLKPGSYVLKEKSAPAGLKKVTTEIKFKVNDDGTVDLKTKSVDNDGKVSISGNHITLENAPIEPKPEKYVNGENKTQKVKSKDEIIEFIVVATVPYGVSKFELTDPIPEPLRYVEDSLQIFIEDEEVEGGSMVMATEEPDYVAIAITSDNDGTIDVSDVYGKNVAMVFQCKIDPNADLKKYKEVVNTAYVYLNNSEDSIPSDEDAEATVLGISDLPDDNGNSKGKGANTGDIAPVALLVLLLTISMIIISIVALRRRRIS